jgi:hypothetical protein
VAQRVGRRAQTSKILSIESAKGRVDSLSNPDNSFFHVRTQERDPKMTAKEQSRSARC